MEVRRAARNGSVRCLEVVSEGCWIDPMAGALAGVRLFPRRI
jgi:hypothetical protein